MNQLPQEEFEAALVQRHGAGELKLHHLTPAIHGAWVGEATQRVEIDHVHLPGGDTLDYPAVFEPEAHRLDVLMLCPTSAQQVTLLGLSGAIIVVCLN